MIYNSPSYLYLYALQFSPSSSWLHECYIGELSQGIRVVEGLQTEWGMCFRTVSLDSNPWALSCWENSIAIGSAHNDILILDAITGSQKAILSGHTSTVRSLTFTSDGTSLVSGGYDRTVKLWDVQTGGVVKTFSGHTSWVSSVSISVDNTTIASGSEDKTIHLWDIQAGACHQIIEENGPVDYISFSPKDPQTLISASNGTVQQWNTGGHKVGPTYNGHRIAFSPDGTQFISCELSNVIVHNINSGVIVAKFDTTHSEFSPCCFSPDNRLVAVTAGYNVCVWNITGLHSYLVETFVGHTDHITSLVFSSPSTIISASWDRSVRFWQIGASFANPVVTDSKSTPLSSAPRSIALKPRNGAIIPCNLPDGVMKTWGISAHLSKQSLQIPTKDSHQSVVQPISNKVIFVWYIDGKVNIWDAEKGELLQTINVPGGVVKDLRVSGDGSKVFCLYRESIQAWDIGTREAVGKVELQHSAQEILATNNSMVWVDHDDEPFGAQAWDFRGLGPPPFEMSGMEMSGMLPDRLHLNATQEWETNMSRMRDAFTGEVIFQLPERYGRPVHVQWNGQYLVACFRSKEVLILDFSYVFL